METRNHSRQKEFVNLLKEFEGNKWRLVLLTHMKLKVIPMHDQAPRHEDVGDTAPCILNCRSRRRCVVSFRSLSRFFLEKELPVHDGY